MRTKVDIKQITIKLNQLVKYLQECSYERLVYLFRENGIPYYFTVIPYLIRKGYLQKDTNGTYSWVRKTPIYFEELDNVIKPQREMRKKNQNGNNQKENDSSLVITEEMAITFLKEKGYKILKPIVIEYSEI